MIFLLGQNQEVTTILDQKEEEGVYYFYIQKNNKISE